MTGLFTTQSDLVAAYARAPDVADFGAFMGVSNNIFSCVLIYCPVIHCISYRDTIILSILFSVH